MTFKEFVKKDEKFQENWWSWHTEPNDKEIKGREQKIQNFKLNQLKDKEFAKKLADEYDLNPILSHYIAEYITNERNNNTKANLELYKFLANDKIGAGEKFLKIDREIKYYLGGLIS